MKRVVILIVATFVLLGLTACTSDSTSTQLYLNDEDNDVPVSSGSRSSSGCSCSGNIYNCDDFSTHREAQACYEKCGGVSNDVHKLDRDADGSACETLP